MCKRQVHVLSSFLFAFPVHVVSKLVIEGVLSELLCADDLVLMNDTIEGFRNKFLAWKEAFESKGLKFVLGKSKMMFCGCIINDGRLV